MNLEGEIASVNLIDRLVDLWRQQFTGAIRFENDGIIKIIYFKGGDVLSASTNDRTDSVDEMLMRAGKVTKEHVKQALTKRKENETLGDALLNLGFITRKELAWGRRVQVIQVIRSVSEWKAGTYTIVADYLPKREEGTIFPLPQLIVEMTVTETERPKFERALESGGVVFEKTPLFGQVFPRLGLNEDADAIVAHIDGFRSASEVAAASKQDAFNVYKLLHALSILGLVDRPRTGYDFGAAPAQSDAGFESAGVADAADAWGSSPTEFELADAPPAVSPPLPSFREREPAPLVSFGTENEIAPTVEIPAPVKPAPPPLVTSLPPLDLDREPVTAPGWGFDEAQIDTARKASEPRSLPSSIRIPPASKEPLRRQPPKPKRSYGVLVTLMLLFIVAGLGYFGYRWWLGRQSQSAPATAVTRREPRPAVQPPVVPANATAPNTATLVEIPPTATAGTAPAGTPRVAAATPSPVKTPVEEPPAEPVQLRTTAPVTEGSGPLRERYDGMAREFAASPRGLFAVQIAIVCDPANVQKSLRTSDAVWFIPISLKGRSCYRLFWGAYDSRPAAERGLSALPASLREGSPAVVTVPR